MLKSYLQDLRVQSGTVTGKTQEDLRGGETSNEMQHAVTEVAVEWTKGELNSIFMPLS